MAHKSASKLNNMTLTSVLLLAIAEPVAQASGDSSQSNEQIAPKRQYFIAPRVGRSPAPTANSQSRAIWSSLEEASLMAPGQIQPIRGYPGPLRSSLMFLIGNRRLIGPRSAAGLLPQARIGRRASPSGLLPQPRVGRRSTGSALDLDSPDEMTLLDGGQQEIAMAATSDNAALNDAVESLLTGRAVTVSAEARNGPDGTIERPSNRAATAFVPRLGKRLANMEGPQMDSLGRLLCANSLDCNQLVLLGALLRGISVQDGSMNLVSSGQLEDILASNNVPQATLLPSSNEEELRLLRMLHRDQLLRRDTRASQDGADEMAGNAVEVPKFGGAKRVAFTPRIGRRR